MKRSFLSFGFSVLILSFALSCGSAFAALETDLTFGAIRDAANGNYARAQKMAAKTSEKKVIDLIEWIKLTRSKAPLPFKELKRFLESHEHWPRAYIVRRNAEQAILREGSDDEIEKWFRKYPPVSASAVIRHAEILMKRREWEKAIPMLHAVWAKTAMEDDENNTVREKLAFLLDEQDMADRANFLLSERNIPETTKLLPLLDEENEATVKARLSLIGGDLLAQKRVKALPESQRKDPALIYDEIRWLRGKERYDAAAKLLQSLPSDLQKDEKWQKERLFLVRQFMSTGDFKKAYALSHEHTAEDGARYIDAEWLSGWIALRGLNKPKDALAHFKKMLAAVKSPVSQARGEYWVGRTFEEIGLKDEAEDWYRKAEEKITTIYGQLASARLKKEDVPPLPADQPPSQETMRKIRSSELFIMAHLLQKAGFPDLANVFAIRLYNDAKTPDEVIALSHLFNDELRRPDLVVLLARRARANGYSIMELGYPLRDIKPDKEAEHAVVLSIIRQESNFAPDAISPVGARGLMQIMPATAKQIARRKNKPFSVQMLNKNPDFNIELGSAYFAELVKRFEKSYVLAIAAYNAGPANVRKWLKTFGYPEENFDTVDWIEMIPFDETRNYVHRVLENLYIYRRFLNYSKEQLTVWEPLLKSI